MKNKQIEEVVEAFIKLNPYSDLARFANRIEPKKLRVLLCTVLVSGFNGETLSIPSKSSLKRTAIVIKIMGALEDIEPNTKEFKKEVRKLSKVLNIPMYQIKHIFQKGNYTI